jgi:chorismate mutase / prephenate dehydratase
MTIQDLAALRKSLDDIDAVLVSALGERARLARQIAYAKAAGDGPVRDTDRETALLQHRSQFGERLGLDPAFVRRIFREILDDSVRRQEDALQTRAEDAEQELIVGFQGTEGAYGHQAALQHFAVAQRPVAFKAYGSFKETLEAVVEGRVDRAMLPIENTTAGSVYESYDLLLRFNLSLVGEEIVDVRHCLLGISSVPLESLTRIHSHPQALSQCSEFLSTLKCEGVSAANTALAAKHVRDLNSPQEAAIASEEAGAHFGLTVLRREIANQAVNYTRFVVVAATPIECDPRIAAKVSMVLSTRHEHGALVRCLNVIADEGLNVTKLESRPRLGTPWEYVFYIDVEGHIASPRMQAALAGLAERTVFVKVLGCYPARELPR